MSDTYFVTIDCPYCGAKNPSQEEVEEGGMIGMTYKDEWDNTWTCHNCGKEFRIIRGEFRAEKIDE